MTGEWISVEERLPEIGDEVDVFESDTEQRVADVWLSINNQWTKVVNGSIMLPVPNVTHWMPLPDPPNA